MKSLIIDKPINSYKFSFEKLEIWQASIKFAKIIYEITNKFPVEERFGLTSQIKRAAISISSNIAEGSAKKSLKDQARYTEIAFGSLLEVLNQFILAFELLFINESDLSVIRTEIESLSRQINALKNSQIRRYDGK